MRTLPQRIASPVALGFILAMCLSAAPAKSFAAGKLTVNPAGVHFGYVPVGTAKSVKAKLVNSGTTALNVSAITPSAAVFTVTGIKLPLTLAAGKSAAFTVTFKPGSVHQWQNQILFQNNGATAKTYMQVFGSGRSAGAEISPANLGFGNVKVGAVTSKNEIVTNTGKYALTINNATASGTPFTITGPKLPLSLAPGKSATFTVKFAPQGPGTKTGTMTIATSAMTPKFSVPLTGTAIPKTSSTLAASPASMSFGKVMVGTTMKKTIALGASGASITVSAPTTTNTEFMVMGASFPMTIAAGKTASFSVKFTPKTSGAATGKITFPSNAANSPAVVSTAGTGAAAAAHSVTLSWNASKSAVNGYNIYRGTTSGGPYSKVNSALNADTNFTDQTVQGGHTYYYVTTAVSTKGTESNDSNQVSAVVPGP